MRECTDAIMVSLAAVGLIVLITLSLALMTLGKNSSRGKENE